MKEEGTYVKYELEISVSLPACLSAYIYLSVCVSVSVHLLVSQTPVVSLEDQKHRGPSPAYLN